MIHLGDITKISGYDAPPVDVVIGGSPCQDLSVAGKRAGLAGARSGLFMEQIRIIKEMRDADVRRGRAGQFIRPRFMVWENVPGTFSSNKGDDFRAVLEETIRVADPDAPDVPLPPKGKWPLADCWMGNGWSVAYRVLDAQFWGVPQRRRRIALVADFGGHAAPEILFVRQGVCGDIEPSKTAGEEDTARAGGGLDSTVHAVMPPLVYENHGQDSRLTGPLDIAPTVAQKFGTGGNNTPLVVSFKYHQGAKANGLGIQEEIAPTLAADGGHTPAVLIPGADVYALSHESFMTRAQKDVAGTLATDYKAPPVVVAMQRDSYARRMTPVECERLQGYPDGWTDIGDWTDSKGKIHKPSDSTRYKALGNSIAIPPWTWLLKRLCGCYERTATMASLFDGIGGFPLIWERLNGPGSCLWASEIEEFPIAVTKRRFGEI